MELVLAADEAFVLGGEPFWLVLGCGFMARNGCLYRDLDVVEAGVGVAVVGCVVVVGGGDILCKLVEDGVFVFFISVLGEGFGGVGFFS